MKKTAHPKSRGIDWTRFEMPLPHPGEAKLMGLRGRQRIERLVRGQQAITADTALRLGCVLGAGPELWTNMQAAHDTSKAAIECAFSTFFAARRACGP